MADSSKIFSDKPRIVRIKRTGLIIGIICFVAVIATIFLFCSGSNQQLSDETLENDPIENTSWVNSSNKIPVAPEADKITNTNLTVSQDREAQLAAALEELELRQKMQSAQQAPKEIPPAYGSPISVDIQHAANYATGNLPVGTVVSTVLLTELTSDLPGESLAQVVRPVYDASQTHILIPQGTKILLQYDSSSLSQNRISLRVTNLILPTGLNQAVDGVVSLDLQGNVGLHDKVNHHYINNFFSMLVPDLASAAQMAGQAQSFNPGAIAGEFATYHSPQLQHSTIQIRRGYQFNLLVTKELTIKNF